MLFFVSRSGSRFFSSCDLFGPKVLMFCGLSATPSNGTPSGALSLLPTDPKSAGVMQPSLVWKWLKRGLRKARGGEGVPSRGDTARSLPLGPKPF